MTTAGPRLHNRQLVIGPEPFSAEEGWRHLHLGRGTWVSHCPRLRTGTARDAEDRDWALFGLAVQTIATEPDPLEQISASPSAAVPELHPAWSGRWLLVGGGDVHLDASGLLGCFFGADVAGRTWASSSPALLARAIAPGRTLAADPRQLRFEEGLSWYQPPRSGLEGIRRLLPSQVLRVADGSIRPRELLPPILPDRPYEETLELLADAFVTALGRVPAGPGPLQLALSAGLDSRVVLAAAERSGTSYVPFMRISARMSAGDRLIAPRLAAALGRRIDVHRRGPLRRRITGRERLPLILQHSAGHVSEGDAQPLLDGVRDRVEGVSPGGWGFGVGKALERERWPPTVSDPDVVARRIAALVGESPSSSTAEGLREWLEWVLHTPQANLDWRDRFYIEQRMAGWQSSKEQVYDMVALERFPPVNCARIYSHLLEVSESRRAVQQHQRDLVQRLCPALARFPANPSDRELGRWRVAKVRLRDDPLRPLRTVARRTVSAVWRRT